MVEAAINFMRQNNIKPKSVNLRESALHFNFWGNVPTLKTWESGLRDSPFTVSILRNEVLGGKVATVTLRPANRVDFEQVERALRKAFPQIEVNRG